MKIFGFVKKIDKGFRVWGHFCSVKLSIWRVGHWCDSSQTKDFERSWHYFLWCCSSCFHQLQELDYLSHKLTRLWICFSWIACMHPANETATPSLIGWAHTQNDPCLSHHGLVADRQPRVVQLSSQYYINLIEDGHPPLVRHHRIVLKWGSYWKLVVHLFENLLYLNSLHSPSGGNGGKYSIHVVKILTEKPMCIYLLPIKAMSKLDVFWNLSCLKVESRHHSSIEMYKKWNQNIWCWYHTWRCPVLQDISIWRFWPNHFQVISIMSSFNDNNSQTIHLKPVSVASYQLNLAIMVEWWLEYRVLQEYVLSCTVSWNCWFSVCEYRMWGSLR